MWTLIKREIRDHWLHIILPAIIIFIALTVLISQMLYLYRKDIPIMGLPEDLLAIYWVPIVLIPAFTVILGVTQIYSDRNRKISAFLLSQPTSRVKLLAAKLIAGLIWIACVTLPFILTSVIVLTIMPPLLPGGKILLIKLIITAGLVNLACYSIGLMCGWGTNKYIPNLFAIILATPLLALLIIKGFGLETHSLLIVVTIVALLKTTNKFMATSL